MFGRHQALLFRFFLFRKSHCVRGSLPMSVRMLRTVWPVCWHLQHDRQRMSFNFQFQSHLPFSISFPKISSIRAKMVCDDLDEDDVKLKLKAVDSPVRFVPTSRNRIEVGRWNDSSRIWVGNSQPPEETLFFSHWPAFSGTTFEEQLLKCDRNSILKQVK